MKYIVYLTTNLVNRKIYVGVHRTETPEIFDGYLGNGLTIQDQSKLRHPKEPFHYAVKKYGIKNFERRTLQVFNTYEEALKLESEIVNEEFIKRKDTYNVTLGGGMPPIKTKHIYQFDLQGNLINDYESILAASKILGVDDSAIGFAVKNHTKSNGFLWATTKEIDLKLFDNTDVQNKKVYLYTLEGEFYKEFPSITQCAQELELSFGAVQRAFYEEYKIKNFYISSKKLDFYLPSKIELTGDIHQYSLDGIYIQTYKTIKEVCNAFSKPMYNINQYIRMGKPYRGYLWARGTKLETLKPYKLSPKTRKVGQYTLDGQLVKVYNTVRAARADFSNVNKVLKGLATQCKGFTFKYID